MMTLPMKIDAECGILPYCYSGHGTSMMTLPLTILEQLPALVECRGIDLRDGETLIHAAGFEDRTLAFAAGMKAHPQSRAILLDYRPENEKNRLGEVKKALTNCGVTVFDDDVIEYHRFNPNGFESTLIARLESQRARRVVIDISTMSKLAIMLVLQVCRNRNLSTRVLYSEAETYGPTEQEFVTAREHHEIHRPTLHGFTGVHGVVRVDSLASVAMQGQPTAAIVFMSLNNALTQLLLNTVYPGRLFLINGRPPVLSWREAATAWVHEQVRKEWDEDNPVTLGDKSSFPLPERVASTLDYRDAMLLLLDLYWRLSATHRILLAPSGSKMQTIACYLMKALHPDIHIEYPSPEGFLPEYSKGIGKRWLVDLGIPSDRLMFIRDAEIQTYLEIKTQ